MKFKDLDKDKVFVTSDLHFWHENILKYCNRPFSGITEMNDTIIDNINNKVPEDAILFILGDFAFTGSTNAIRVLTERINASIVLIYGNHDYQNGICKPTKSQYFIHTADILRIMVKDDEVHNEQQEIVLCHYPMIVWHGSHRGVWQLFGHIHTNNNAEKPPSELGYVSSRISANQYDVGVDNNNFTPLSYDEVKEIITKQNLATL